LAAVDRKGSSLNLSELPKTCQSQHHSRLRSGKIVFSSLFGNLLMYFEKNKMHKIQIAL
jgi:hypothetical protein